MTTLLIATRNAHKVGEIQALLGGHFRALTLHDFPGAPQVVEDADTLAGNAVKKAAELARWVAGKPAAPEFVLADDSGLEVDALNGAPGVHSARFAALDRPANDPATAGNSPDADNNAKLLRLLKNVPLAKRTARFRCVIALVPVPRQNSPAPAAGPQTFDGACTGRIQLTAAGRGGFGYDPLFVPDGLAQSFAELGEDVKNTLSHRAKALAKLKKFLGRNDA
jgi:XTP/dITP diphosphohydrolase